MVEFHSELVLWANVNMAQIDAVAIEFPPVDIPTVDNCPESRSVGSAASKDLSAS